MSDRLTGHYLRTVSALPVRSMLALLIGLAVLSGCSTRGGDIPYAVKDFGPPDRPVPAEAGYDLPLGPLDVLRISVFRAPDLSGEFQVDYKGMLDLPLIGAVSVRDLDPAQLATSLERLYSERYLNNPDITVRVLNSNSNSVTVEGGVNSPGIFQLPGRTTLVGAIALARGISSTDGNAKRVAIFRKRGGATVAAAYDIVAIRHGKMENPVVYPGDTVVVDSSELRQLYRDLIQTLPAFTLFRQL